MRLQSKRYQVRPHKSDYLRMREQVIAFLAIIAMMVFLKVWQKVNVDHQIRRNGKLEQDLLVLQGETALLEVRISELRSMQRIGELAESRLKLVPVPTIVLREKGMVGKLVDKLEDWQRRPSATGSGTAKH